MTDKQDEWLNPPIEQLQAGDWVCIANGDWYEVREVTMYPLLIILDGCAWSSVIRLTDLITATHRGDKPPVTDRERLQHVLDNAVCYNNEEPHESWNSRQAIDAAMQQEGNQ